MLLPFSMRLLVVLAAVLASGGPRVGANGGVEEAGNLLAGLDEEQKLALREALADGRVMPPEEAQRRAREFLREPAAELKLLRFEDRDDVGIDGPCYEFERGARGAAEDADRGRLKISAATGRVHWMSAGEGRPGEGRALETEEEARMVAKAFLRERWPEYSRRKWSEDHPCNSHTEDDCEFTWTQVLNEDDTRAAYDLSVDVEMSTGRVLFCSIPPDRVNGPTVPGVALAQARRLAAPEAYRNPAVVPFSLCYPRIREDNYGVTGLAWEFQQAIWEEDAEGVLERSYVTVDGISGEGAYSYHLPGKDLFADWRRSAQEEAQRTLELLQLPPLPTATVRGGAGELYSYEKPLVREGETWLRVELLRGFGVRVFGGPRRPMLRSGRKRLAAEECGARFTQGGWWVPLGRVARSFGWRVKWQQAAGTVEVEHPPVKPFGAGGSGDPLPRF